VTFSASDDYSVGGMLV